MTSKETFYSYNIQEYEEELYVINRQELYNLIFNIPTNSYSEGQYIIRNEADDNIYITKNEYNEALYMILLKNKISNLNNIFNKKLVENENAFFIMTKNDLNTFTNSCEIKRKMQNISLAIAIEDIKKYHYDKKLQIRYKKIETITFQQED